MQSLFYLTFYAGGLFAAHFPWLIMEHLFFFNWLAVYLLFDVSSFKKNGPPYALKNLNSKWIFHFKSYPHLYLVGRKVQWKWETYTSYESMHYVSQTIEIATVACQSSSIPGKIAWINEVSLIVWLCNVTKSIIFIYSLTYPPAIATLFSSCPTDQFSVKWKRIDWCPNFFFSFPLPNLFWARTVGFIKNTFLHFFVCVLYLRKPLERPSFVLHHF